MTTTAISYSRFSSAKQQSGRSEDRQGEVFQQACAEHGWVPSDLSYIDRGKSAFRNGRDGRAKNLSGDLGKFLELVEDKRVKPGTVLVVENPDRLSRAGFDETYDIIRSVVRAGVTIYWAERRMMIDRNSLRDNVAVVVQLACEAERSYRESQVKSTRLRDVWASKRRKAAAGQPHGKRCPGWIRLVNGKYELVPDRAAVVRRMFALLTDGNCGLVQVARTLNEDGVPTWGRFGCKWTAATILSIVRSRVVLGELQLRSGNKPAGEPIPNYYPGVVDDATFWKAQRAMDARRVNGKGRPGKEITSLFTRLLIDASTGERMRAANVGNSANQSASSVVLEGVYRREENRGKGKATFQYGAFEEAFLKLCRELKPADILPGKEVGQAAMGALDQAEAKLETLTVRKAEVETSMAEGKGSFDMLAGVLTRLNDNIAEQQRCVDELRAEVAESREQPLGQAQEILDLLRDAKGDQLTDLRRRLKGAVRNLVERAYCLIVRETRMRRHLLCEVHFKSGAVRGFLVSLRAHQDQRSVRVLLQQEGKVRCAGWPKLGLSEFAKASKREQKTIEGAVVGMSLKTMPDAAHNHQFDLLRAGGVIYDRDARHECDHCHDPIGDNPVVCSGVGCGCDPKYAPATYCSAACARDAGCGPRRQLKRPKAAGTV